MTPLTFSVSFTAAALCLAGCSVLLHRREPLLAGVFSGLTLLAIAGAVYNLIQGIPA